MKLLSHELQRLADDRVTIAELQTTRQMKALSAYKNLNQPHLHVTKLKNDRCPGSGACDGERVPLIFVYKRNCKRFEQAEDPEYAQKHNLPIDKVYYIERLRSVTAIFADLLGAPLHNLLKRCESRAVAQRSGQRSLSQYFQASPPS
jgi:DNA polymerase elongation subunit (family B)